MYKRQLDAVHLFFPDPWPKVRHRRRRFVSADTLDLLADRLTPDGQVLLATDSPAYVGTVRRETAAHGAFTVVVAQRPVWPPVAGFEAKAIAAGRPVTELRLVRGADQPPARGEPATPGERATRIELA